MRHDIAVLLASVALALPGTAGAQSIFDSELRSAPQFVRLQLGTPVNETISELAVPVFVSVPFGSRFTMDLGSAYARVKVTTPGAISEISGLTDTQVRGNLTLGSDFVVLTGGVNLPTGQSTVTSDQVAAAGRIGNDFLAFPISNMGTGFASTAGIAVARPVGNWNIGFGGALRRSSAYDPFDLGGQRLRYQPGSEYRARVGVDRPVAAGRVALGLTYSSFGDDRADNSVYNTGDRVIAQGVFTSTLAANELTVAAYNVFRAPGRYASLEPAGRENIGNLYVGIALHALGTVVEPSIEGRHWLQNVATSGGSSSTDRSQSSMLATFGLRTRLRTAGLAAYPSVGYTVGRLASLTSTNDPTTASLTGFRGALSIRVAP